MANHEDYLDALTAFGRDAPREIPPILEHYLNGVAKNGETLFQWPLLKPLIVGKMEQVIEELQRGLTSENITSRPNVENVRFDVMRTRIMDAVHKFTGAPFTIQRLCELLVDPRRHYKRSDKFMRGLEKNVLVVSTVDPFGRKVVSEVGNKHLVNGMDNGIPIFSRDSGISSNLPPVPGWVTTAATTTSRMQDSPEKAEHQESNLASNGVASSLVNPVFGDQGDQTPAVHAEEVVETAVSLEVSETGPEATGAGEALADEEEEDMGTEDTNASTSSSSSSSSEDLSNSDTGESASTVNTLLSVVTSSSSEPAETRPWASIAAEAENKEKEHSMDLEPLPNTSKSYDSEYQDPRLTVSQSQPSTLSSPATEDIGCPSQMDTTSSTSSHTGPPAEAGNQADESVPLVTESDPMSQAHDRTDLSSVTESQEEEEGRQDISSSSASFPSSPPHASESGPEAVMTPSHSDGTSGQQQLVDSKEQDGIRNEAGEQEGSDCAVEQSPTTGVVSSSETSSLPPSEGNESRDVTSSNHQQMEDSDEPPAKHRRLSEDTELSSSPLEPNTHDLEPSSSSTEGPDVEASSTESPFAAAAASNIGSFADTTAAVTTSHSPLATKTALDSTTDSFPQVPSTLESTVVMSEVTTTAEVGGGDGDMPQSTLREVADPEGSVMKTFEDSVEGVKRDIKDEISSDTAKANSASQEEPSSNDSHEEPMEQN